MKIYFHNVRTKLKYGVKLHLIINVLLKINYEKYI